jgi:cytochrome c-type biogenesis protein CcmH/NrfG
MTRAQLLDEITLREASLRDAQRELDAGELSLEAFEQLRARETALLETLRHELASLPIDAPTSPVAEARASSGGRTRRMRYLVGALLAFAVAVGIVLAHSFSTRQAGDSITGSISLSTSQQVTALLSQAEGDTANGNLTAALTAYQGVLSIEPNNVTALTESGWLTFSAGTSTKNLIVIQRGVDELHRAVEIDGNNSAALLYYGIAAYDVPGSKTVSKKILTQFLKTQPSRALLLIANHYLVALGLQ